MTDEDEDDDRPTPCGLLGAAIVGAPVGVLVVATDGQVVESSGELRRLLGIRRAIADLADLDTVPLPPIGRLLRFIQAGEPGAVRCERAVPVSGAGGVGFVDFEASVVERDGARGGVVIVHDTTATARIGEALARSEANLRQAQALAQLGSWEYDLRTGALELSDEIYRILEEDPQSFDTSLDAFFGAVHPADREWVTAAYQRSLVDRRAYDLVHRVRVGGGAVKYVRERWRNFYAADGEPLRTIGTVQDVTSLHAAESALQRLNRDLEARVEERTRTIREQAALIEQIDDALVVADPRGMIRWWNGGAARIFGFTAEEVAGRSLEALSAGDSLIERWRRGESLEGELRLQRADGGVFDAWVSLSALHHDGELAGIIAVIIDITDRKRTERELRRARDIAEQASRAKSEFLSSITHELRTPLHAILGSAELLGVGVALSPGQREQLGDISRAGEHLLEVVDNVLDLVSVESGAVTLADETVHVGALIEACVERLGERAAHRGVAIDVALAEGPLLARGDRRRLEKVLLNLLSNAIKFNAVGGRVTLRAGRGRGCEVEIAVEDTGAGIDAARLRDLFTAFNRLGHEGGAIAGSGIGLVLAKRLVELMRGTILVHSELGVGSTFTVRLPAVVPLVLPEELMVHALTRDGGRRREAPLTVLYIDDLPANVQMMESVLVGVPGARLVTAADLEGAAALVAEARPDAVFLDACALGGDGSRFVSELRAREETAATPVYSLCGRAGRGGGCLRACGPVTGELRKPLDLGAFHRVLEGLGAERGD
ncbi:MAG: PAS domain S-box protein [Nannocystaceae bacterium]